MTGGHIQVLASDMRGHDREIAKLALLAAEEVLQGVAHHGSSREPQRKPEADTAGECKQFHLLAELAVIALLGLFEHREILVKHALLRESDSVYTGQLLPALIAFPIGARDRCQLDGLDIIDVLDMRSAAKVREVAVGVERDLAVLEILDELALVFVVLVFEILEGVRLGHLLALEGLLGAGEFNHLVLNLLEIRLGNLPVAEIHIIVEPIFHGRAYSELDARIK